MTGKRARRALPALPVAIVSPFERHDDWLFHVLHDAVSRGEPVPAHAAAILKPLLLRVTAGERLDEVFKVNIRRKGPPESSREEEYRKAIAFAVQDRIRGRGTQEAAFLEVSGFTGASVDYVRRAWRKYRAMLRALESVEPAKRMAGLYDLTLDEYVVAQRDAPRAESEDQAIRQSKTRKPRPKS